MNFPRYMFVVGGAGKNLAYATFEKEWILREILRPQFAPTEVDITIIDTAIVEENSDRERIKNIERSIDKITEEYREESVGSGLNIGRINITYKLLTKEMNLQSPYALIGIEDKVKKATGASTWWINDSKLGKDWSRKVLNKENFQELNFSKGVYRKRAIGKAIYYKAISEGLFNININSSAEIDIIVGLGGGTGSGIAFDLAKKLKTIQPTANVTLFGILSTLSESPDEKANNFAMLGEVEHAYLNGNSPFKEVILIPMEITEFPGREQASDVHERRLKEFDETVPHILVAYHNNQAERLFAGFPYFAPFIIATSQLVRYNVESIKKLKDNLIVALGDKETSLKNEEEMYGIIRKFVEDFYPNEFQKGIPEDDKDVIKGRLEKFNMVLEHDLFKELNYSGIVTLKKVVEDGIKGSGSDDIEKQVLGIKSDSDMMSVGSDGYKEETDKMLYNILKRDIDMMDSMRDILNLVNNNVKDDLIRDTLKVIIKIDEERVRNRLNKLREMLKTLTTKGKQLSGDINAAESELKNYRENVEKQIEKNNIDWRQEEIRNIEHLNLIDELRPLIISDMNSLKNELSEYASRINKANNIKAIESEPRSSIENLVEKIDKQFDRVGIYYGESSLITRNLNNLQEYRKNVIESGKSIPFLDKLLKTGRYQNAQSAKNKTMLKIAELNADKVFEVKGVVVTCVYNFNVEEKVDLKKGEIITPTVNRTKDKFVGANASLFIGLGTSLNSVERRRDINIRDIVLSHIGYDIDIRRIEDYLKDKNADMSKVSKETTVLKALETLITKDIKDILGSHARKLKNYHDTISNIRRDMKSMREAKKDSIRYITDIQPTNIYRATITGANINNILEDPGEKLILRQSLRDATNRTVDIGYNMLLRRVLENDTHDRRWSRSKVLNAFVTIANIDPAVIDAGDIVVKAFDIERDNRSEWKSSFGDKWGVGCVLFVTGILLDNIKSVAEPSAGYYRHYKDEEKKSAVFLHHSYMLEEGMFIKRKSIFNVEKKSDRDLLLQDDKIVEKIFSDNYDEKKLEDIFESPRVDNDLDKDVSEDDTISMQSSGNKKDEIIDTKKDEIIDTKKDEIIDTKKDTDIMSDISTGAQKRVNRMNKRSRFDGANHVDNRFDNYYFR